MVTIFCNIQTTFTFSELWDVCVCVCVCVCDQQDSHFFSLIYFDLTILYMFKQLIVHHLEVMSVHAAYNILPCIYVVSSY